MSGERAENLPFLLVVISLEEWQVSVIGRSVRMYLSLTYRPICSLQKHPFAPKVATKAFDEVMRKVYYALGTCGNATHRRAILIDLPYMDAASDAGDERLEDFEGVQLVGEGRAVGSLATAIECKPNHLLSSAILV
jgi:hypothetical protein